MTEPQKYARILIKPDGMVREITMWEAQHTIEAWNGLLDHLSGLPPTPNTPHSLIAQLPTKIASRLSYRPGYDLSIWCAHAAAAQRCQDFSDARDVYGVSSAIMSSIGMTRTKTAVGRLTAGGVEALYSASRWYAEDPRSLTDYLTSGPIRLDSWRGPSLELALVAKLVVRWALGVEGRRNLIHCDLVTAKEDIRIVFGGEFFTVESG